MCLCLHMLQITIIFYGEYDGLFCFRLTQQISENIWWNAVSVALCLKSMLTIGNNSDLGAENAENIHLMNFGFHAAPNV